MSGTGGGGGWVGEGGRTGWRYVCVVVVGGGGGVGVRGCEKAVTDGGFV